MYFHTFWCPVFGGGVKYDNELFVGHPGIKGDRPGNFAIQSADLIIILGSSLHTLTTGYEIDKFSPNAYKIQIEIDPAIIQRQQIKIDQKINSSIQSFLTKIEKILLFTNFYKDNFENHNLWRSCCKKWKYTFSVQKEKHKKSPDLINYYDIIEHLSVSSKESDILISDSGSAFYTLGQAFRPKLNQRVIISGSLGAMGFALPAATGASLASPECSVICITGDGSFQTNIHELATISHHKLNIKLFILNNHGYVSIRNTQNNFFQGQYVGVDEKSGISFPSIELIAQAYSLNYVLIKKHCELKNCIEKVMKIDGPIICEIITTSEQEIIPTVSSLIHSDGTLRSEPLHNMYPFFDSENLKTYLSWALS